MFIKNFIKGILSWVSHITILLVSVILLNIYVVQTTAVSGESMMQTLHDGDVYIISKTRNIFNSYPNYDDIVVVDSRVSENRTLLTAITDIYQYNVIATLITGNMPRIYWVKRIIGLPGDKLYMDRANGIVYRNNEPLQETYINPTEKPIYYDTSFTVPENHVFVMGDNRNHSRDSRDIGAVPIENVIGVAKVKIKSGG